MADSKDNRRLALAGAALALITLAAYWPVFHAQFITVFDDDRYVTDNAHVQAGLSWAGMKWAFTSIVCSNWHPLTMLSLMLNYQWSGLNPAWYHATNLLLHIVNALLLLVWLYRTTGAVWRSALVAALFAWHPMHVESVAWIAERKDVLSTLFWMLALISYSAYARRSGLNHQRSTIYYCLTLALFALGLMSKPMVVTLPCVLLLVDFWPLGRMLAMPQTYGRAHLPLSREVGERAGERRRSFVNPARRPLNIISSPPQPSPAPSSQEREKKGQRVGAPLPLNRFGAVPFKNLVLEKIPFFALSALACVVTVLAQKHGGTAVASLDSLPFFARVGNAAVSYGRYLLNTIWPDDLAVYYPHPGAWPALEIAAAGALLAGVTLCVWQWRRDRPYLAFGWFWFLGTLVPVIGLVQVGGQSMADRYGYVPLIGIFVMAAWGAGEVVAQRARLRPIFAGVGGILLAGCVTVTARQVTFWRDSETLFKHAIAVTKDNYIANQNLGAYLSVQNRDGDALPYFREALRIKPTADAEVNLGSSLTELGQLPEAEELLRRALQAQPDHPQGRLAMGKLDVKQGRKAEAAEEFREALRLRPDWASAELAWGRLLAEQGDLAGAAEHLAAAARADAQDPVAEEELAGLLSREKRVGEAVAAYREAIARYERLFTSYSQGYSQSPEPYNNLAWLLATNPNAEVRNGAEAVRLAQRACDLTGGKRPQMLGTLAAAYAEAGRFDDAIATANRARDLARQAGEADIAARNEELVKLYEAHQAFHDSYQYGTLRSVRVGVTRKNLRETFLFI